MILLAPAFFVLSFFLCGLRMTPPPIDSMFDETIDCTLVGKIERIQREPIKEEEEMQRKKKETGKLIVSNVQILLPKTPKNVSKNKESERGNCMEQRRFRCQKVLLSLPETKEYRVGNLIKVSGKLVKFSKPTNYGQFDEQTYYKIQGINFRCKAGKIDIISSDYARISHGLEVVKLKLLYTYKGVLLEKDFGTIAAMLLGEKRYLDPELKQLFQESGIAHILAISGLHISLLGLGLYRLLRMKVSIGRATTVTIIVLILYAIMTGFQVSTNRAVLMIVVALCAKILGKTYDIPCAMAVSALILLLKNPLQLFSCGFQLSFGAVLGIVGVYEPIWKRFHMWYNQRLEKKKVAGEVIGKSEEQRVAVRYRVVQAFLVSASIQVVTLPVLLYHFYEISLYAVFTNLFVLPSMSLVIGLAISAGIVGLVCKTASLFLIGGTHYLFVLFEFVCNLTQKIPYATVIVGRPNEVQICLYYVGIVLILYFIHKQVSFKIGLLLCILPILFVPLPNHMLEITMLDVGQGDGICLSHRGFHAFIDGGSTSVSKVGTYRILPFLKAKGIASLDYAMISHMDEDHINGLKEVIQSGYLVKHLVVPNTTMRDEAYLTMVQLANQYKIPVLYFEKGDFIHSEELSLTCLHPTPNDHPVTRNEYSMVLQLKFKEFDMLFTGDLEGGGEDEVLRLLAESKELQLESEQSQKGQQLMDIKDAMGQSDILKVAHHGSKGSTNMEFLNVVKPKYALISAGKHNSYQHPNKELIDRLLKFGSDVHVTKECGAISILTNGERMRITTYQGTKN